MPVRPPEVEGVREHVAVVHELFHGVIKSSHGSLLLYYNMFLMNNKPATYNFLLNIDGKMKNSKSNYFIFNILCYDFL